MTDASRLSFRIDAQASGSQARAGTFRTLHGEVATPLFMPVGTQAVVKAQTAQTLQDSGAQILLANTYHLLLRPGAEVFRRMGGIHRFMSWPKLIRCSFSKSDGAGAAALLGCAIFGCDAAT